MAGGGPRVFLIAGEASGDKLGAALMAGLRDLAPGVEFSGIGGAEMTDAGLTSLFDMQELSLMGLVEILPKYFHLKRRIRQTAQAVLDFAPDVVVTIDSPDFCLRVARIVRARGRVPIVHYVAPSVWAWRPGRAARMAPLVDHVLTLLPFEPPLMQAAGMAATFVGHPVVAESRASEAEARAFRAEHGLAGAPLLLVLPGSRRGEIARLGPVLGAALPDIVTAVPGLRLVVPVAPGRMDEVAALMRGWPGGPLLIAPEEAAAKRAAFRAADAALAASGTVALELAANETPMVVAYDMNPISRAIIKRMMLTDSVNLVNLVSESRVVPEFIGANCRAELIAPAMIEVLRAPTAQLQEMRLTMERLGAGGEAPGLRAARAVLQVAGAGVPPPHPRSI